MRREYSVLRKSKKLKSPNPASDQGAVVSCQGPVVRAKGEKQGQGPGVRRKSKSKKQIVKLQSKMQK
jgi:hypothetical protein